MIGRRLVTATMLLAGLASACTAIVLGKLGDTGELPIDPNATGGGAPSSFDECALLGEPDAANECATCIAENCEADVSYACSRGEAGTKSWWSALQGCARNPYKSYGPPGLTSYACASYDKPDATPITGVDDEQAKQRRAELCVRDRCLKTATPACKLCPVRVDLPTVNEERLLESDPCGACIKTNCAAELVRCCTTSVLQYHVQFCGYTNDDGYKGKCHQLAEPAASPLQANSLDSVCDYDVRKCYVANCASTACK
jgi:hypothetical protein